MGFLACLNHPTWDLHLTSPVDFKLHHYPMAVLLALIAVMLPSGAPPYLARNMAIGHGVFVTLFTASGLMFRHASLAGLK